MYFDTLNVGWPLFCVCVGGGGSGREWRVWVGCNMIYYIFVLLILISYNKITSLHDLYRDVWIITAIYWCVNAREMEYVSAVRRAAGRGRQTLNWQGDDKNISVKKLKDLKWWCLVSLLQSRQTDD